MERDPVYGMETMDIIKAEATVYKVKHIVAKLQTNEFFYWIMNIEQGIMNFDVKINFWNQKSLIFVRYSIKDVQTLLKKHPASAGL